MTGAQTQPPEVLSLAEAIGLEILRVLTSPEARPAVIERLCECCPEADRAALERAMVGGRRLVTGP